jgi:transcriptional regulator with XRE-family HTH domain
MRKGEVTVNPPGLRALRTKSGLSQAALARAASEAKAARSSGGESSDSLSESLIALIETGRRQPSLENVEAIAAALGVPVDAFAVVHETPGQVPA